MEFSLIYQDDTGLAGEIVALGQLFAIVRVEIDEYDLRVMIGPSVKRRSGSVRRFKRRFDELYRQYHGRHGVTEHALLIYAANEFGFLESIEYAFKQK